MLQITNKSRSSNFAIQFSLSLPLLISFIASSILSFQKFEVAGNCKENDYDYGRMISSKVGTFRFLPQFKHERSPI